ncbi:hypothetical protein BD410DRAFT_754329 [Rickenella mellea]|uniref:RlpA-like protein double-psi beta-barrel domain-containing protein n=1 Tax=Rickenella mellea TaxID=50990 RepID=A0A4Y7PR96_9AGAM|nr:hypothetical protein BD410DRAFT_754329 [Rickenella mellea]
MQLLRAPSLFVTICSLAIGALAAPSPVPATNATLVSQVTHVGRGTFFDPDGGIGACGFVEQNTDHIVAIGSQRFANGGNCNQWIQISANGKTAFGLTRDSCPGCGVNDLDLTPALFQKFAPLDVGVITVTWNFLPFGFQPPS